jgi:hypothetical protein
VGGNIIERNVALREHANCLNQSLFVMRPGAGNKGTVNIEQYQAFVPAQLCVPFFGFRGGWRRSGGFRSCLLNSFFKRLDALPQSFAKFRKLLRPEDEEGDGKDDEQMLGLQQTFNHDLEKLLTIFTLLYVTPDASGLVA